MMRRIGIQMLVVAALATAANLSVAGGNGCSNCAPAPAVVHGVGSSCGDCGPTVKSSLHSKIASHQDVRFMFGSSKNFFAPCNSGMCDMFGSPRKQHCGLPTYGSGIGQPAENCKGPVTFTTR